MLVTLCFLGSAVALLPLGAALSPWLELTSHFRWQYASVLAILAAWAWKRHCRAAIAAALVAGWNATLLAPAWLPETAATSPSTQQDASQAGEVSHLSIMTFNVLGSNDQHAAIRRYLAEERPDILLLIELTPDILAALNPESLGYTHQIARPRRDNFGIGLFSRRPATGRIFVAGDPSLPAAEMTVDLEGRAVTIWGLHPLPPGTGQMTRRRDDVLRETARLAADHVRPLVVAGDLNVSPWSPAFTELLARSGLRDSRRGFGLGLSWWPPGMPWFAIPIDHVLLSPEWRVLDRRLGPRLGSDHRPVIAHLAL